MASGQRSTEARREDRVAVTMRGSARVAVSIEFIDLSPNGVRARLSLPLPIGTVIKIGLPREQSRHAKVVWTEDGVTGLAPLPPEEFRLMAEEATRDAAPAA
jgi:hypothetical protein